MGDRLYELNRESGEDEKWTFENCETNPSERRALLCAILRISRSNAPRSENYQTKPLRKSECRTAEVRKKPEDREPNTFLRNEPIFRSLRPSCRCGSQKLPNAPPL